MLPGDDRLFIAASRELTLENFGIDWKGFGPKAYAVNLSPIGA